MACKFSPSFLKHTRHLSVSPELLLDDVPDDLLDLFSPAIIHYFVLF